MLVLLLETLVELVSELPSTAPTGVLKVDTVLLVLEGTIPFYTYKVYIYQSRLCPHTITHSPPTRPSHAISPSS